MDELQVISQSDIDSFSSTPNFQIDIEFQVSDEDMTDDWISCTNDYKDILLSSLRARDTIYQQCRKRYILLHRNRKELLKRESLRGPLCNVLSEALFWLDDLHGSLKYLNELKNLLAEPSVKLSRIIQIVSALCESQEYEEINAELETFDEISRELIVHISKPCPCFSMNVVQDDLNQVLEEWELCKSEIGEQLAIEIFSRYASVTTNELENVFEVEGSTWHRLVSKGFLENSIAGISENSKIKSKSRIVRILKNTYKCVNEVGDTLASNYESYDDKFICKLHADLMDGENFETEVDESGIELCIMVIPAGETSQHPFSLILFNNNDFFQFTGEYRRKGCWTYHFPSGESNELAAISGVEAESFKVRYCKFEEIPRLMVDYCEEARRVLIDPAIDLFMKVCSYCGICG